MNGGKQMAHTLAHIEDLVRGGAEYRDRLHSRAGGIDVHDVTHRRQAKFDIEILQTRLPETTHTSQLD